MTLDEEKNLSLAMLSMFATPLCVEGADLPPPPEWASELALSCNADVRMSRRSMEAFVQCRECKKVTAIPMETADAIGNSGVRAIMAHQVGSMHQRCSKAARTR